MLVLKEDIELRKAEGSFFLLVLHSLRLRLEDSWWWDTDRFLPSWKIELVWNGSINQNRSWKTDWHFAYFISLIFLTFQLCLTFPSLFEQCLKKAKNLVVILLSPEWGREEYCILETLRGKREMGIEHFINYTCWILDSTADYIKELFLIFTVSI